MLEFIVLGQIPGTHIQITYAWFVFAVLASFVWLDLKVHNAHSSKAKVKK